MHENQIDATITVCSQIDNQPSACVYDFLNNLGNYGCNWYWAVISKLIGSIIFVQGIILVIFQSEGNTPDRNERFIMCVSGAEMTSAD